MEGNSMSTNDNKSNVCMNEENGQKPQNWDTITALDFIVAKAKGSKLNKPFWECCAEPLSYLEYNLSLSKAQIVFLAILIEAVSLFHGVVSASTLVAADFPS